MAENHRPERRRDRGSRDAFTTAAESFVAILRDLYRVRVAPLAERVDTAHGLIRELRADLDAARLDVARLRRDTEGGA